MKKKTYKKPHAPSHAGQILKSGFIEQYSLPVATVADLLGITREHLSRILNGHMPITADLASKLELLTKVPASQWLTIQAKYDLYLLEKNTAFKEYKKILENWASSALLLQPQKRRGDKKILALVAKASELAKHLGRKKNIKVVLA
jgi:antitoxin HigA-1